MAQSPASTTKPTLSAYLFWDCDASKIDYEARWRFVIERALTRGRWADVKAIFNHYGPEKVKEALLQARDLDAKTLHFWAFYFKTPIETFRCYEQMRSSQPLWPH